MTDAERDRLIIATARAVREIIRVQVIGYNRQDVMDADTELGQALDTIEPYIVAMRETQLRKG